MHLVSTAADLDSALRSLRGASRYFLDTEFESSRRGKQLSLIQVSAGEEIWLVDALADLELGPLGDVLCRADVQWVMHAGLQDVELLTDEFRCSEPPQLFDTQIVWSLLGPEASVSLAFLQYKVLGVRATKGYQADDWMRRPLPEMQLRYAADDILHLPELHRSLMTRAHELGRPLDLLHAACREFLLPSENPPAPLTFRSFRNAWQLDAAGQRALKELVQWTNEHAAAGQKVPLQSRTLLAIASRNPKNTGELGRIKGVPAWWVKQEGRQMLSRMAAARARTGNEEELEPPAYGSFEDNRIEAQLQLARALACEAVQAAPEVALPSGLMKRIVAESSSSGRLLDAAEQLTGWRVDLVKEAFAHSLDTVDRLSL